MFPLRRFTALLGFSLIGISTAHAVTLPPSSTGMSFVDIDTPISNPFVGGTLLQTLTSPQQSITNISNISHQPYVQSNVSLTTQVYRLASGNLGFAYTINSQFSPDTLDPLSFAVVTIPRLSIPGFQTHPVDLAANMIPGGSGQRAPVFTAYRRASNNDMVVFSFANDPVPAEVPAFYSLFAGTPISLYVTSDARAFQSINAILRVNQRDGRDLTGSGFITDLSLESLAPSFGDLPTGTGVPEPLTASTLPLAAFALTWRLRRRWA